MLYPIFRIRCTFSSPNSASTTYGCPCDFKPCYVAQPAARRVEYYDTLCSHIPAHCYLAETSESPLSRNCTSAVRRWRESVSSDRDEGSRAYASVTVPPRMVPGQEYRCLMRVAVTATASSHVMLQYLSGDYLRVNRNYFQCDDLPSSCRSNPYFTVFSMETPPSGRPRRGHMSEHGTHRDPFLHTRLALQCK